jgi:hypothetical protein
MRQDVLAKAESLGWPDVCPQVADEAGWRAFVARVTPERLRGAMAWLDRWERDQDVIDEWNRRDAERRCA